MERGRSKKRILLPCTVDGVLLPLEHFRAIGIPSSERLICLFYCCFPISCKLTNKVRIRIIIINLGIIVGLLTPIAVFPYAIEKLRVLAFLLSDAKRSFNNGTGASPASLSHSSNIYLIKEL